MNIFSSLKARIVFVSGLAIALIATALLIAAAQMQAEVESRYEAEAFNGKRLLWQRIIEGRFEVMRGEIFSITRNSAAMSSLTEGNATDLANHMTPTFNRLKASEIIDELQILSATGQALFISPQDAPAVRGDGLVQKALQSGKIVSGIEHNSKGSLNLVFAIPLYKSPGKIAGIAVFTRNMQSVLAEFKRSEGSDVILLGSNGKMEFTTNESLYKGIALQTPALGDKKFSVQEMDGDVYAVLVQPMQDADKKPIGHLVSVSEYTESYSKQNSIELYSIIGIAVVFLAVLIALNWYIRSAVRPLDEVKDVLQAVADGDLTSHIHVHSKDEIGQMLTSVVAMISRLRDMIGEVTHSTGTMANSSNELLQITARTSHGVQQQQSQIE